MTLFSNRDRKIARTVARRVADLWMDNRLTANRVRRVIREVIPNATIDAGAWRTSVLLTKTVLKVPHHPDAIRSTMVEHRLFQATKRNRVIARHFPTSEVVTVDGVPVMIQERIPMVASQEVEDDHPLAEFGQHQYVVHPAHRSAMTFAKRLGIGDCHLGNYGWRSNRRGYYPVFFDCEVGTGMTDHTNQAVHRIASKTVKWPGYRVRKDVR